MTQTQGHPPIIVDDREQRAGLDRALREALGREVAVARLELGDVRIGERVVIERKAAADFVASLLERRLDQQLAALARCGGGVRPVLIVEGDFTAAVLAGIGARAVRQALLAVQFDWQIALLRTRGLEDTAQWIAALAEREAGQGASLPLALDPQQIAQAPRRARVGRGAGGAGSWRAATACSAAHPRPGRGQGAGAAGALRHDP
jgi:ERCC4-type nuclease